MNWKGLPLLLISLLWSACSEKSSEHAGAQPHDHGEGQEPHHAHEAQHTHASKPAEAAERSPESRTLWTSRGELFVEFAPLVVGTESQFAAHVSRISDNAPCRDGVLTVTLEGPESLAVRETAPKRPGIFGPRLTPQKSGTYRLTIAVEGPDVTETFNVGEVTVYARAEDLPPEEPEAIDEGISFLKEQAWRIPFRTELAQAGTLPQTLPGFGRLEAVPGRSAQISAPVSGLVLPPENGNFPVPGQAVIQEQVLALLAPGLIDGQDVSTLERELRQAQSKLSLAQSQLDRLARLAEQQAASPKEVEEARAQVALLEAEQKAASQRLTSLGSVAGTRVALQAPMTGRLTSLFVTGQQRVTAGQPLFELVESSALRLRVEVAESELSRLVGVQDAWLSLPGQRVPVALSSLGGRLLSVGSVVDAQTRTVPVFFEVRNARGQLYPGMALSVQVQVQAPRPSAERLSPQADESPVILPLEALVDDNGQPVVYLQKSGEKFERREVVVGARSGDRVSVVQGLQPGERVVTRGGVAIRLASLSASGFGEGHSH